MDSPRILNNSFRSDLLLRTKLKILDKTLRVRGVEVSIVKSTNNVYNTVHGYNNFDIDGDRSDESSTKSSRLVINLNALEHVGEKSSQTQTVYHTQNIADEGDLIIYKSFKYEYAFRVSRKSTYGERDFLYEYELEHFKTIELGPDQFRKIIYYNKDIDKYFEDHNSPNDLPSKISTEPDWTSRIDKITEL